MVILFGGAVGGKKNCWWLTSHFSALFFLLMARLFTPIIYFLIQSHIKTAYINNIRNYNKKKVEHGYEKKMSVSTCLKMNFYWVVNNIDMVGVNCSCRLSQQGALVRIIVCDSSFRKILEMRTVCVSVCEWMNDATTSKKSYPIGDGNAGETKLKFVVKKKPTICSLLRSVSNELIAISKIVIKENT